MCTLPSHETAGYPPVSLSTPKVFACVSTSWPTPTTHASLTRPYAGSLKLRNSHITQPEAGATSMYLDASGSTESKRDPPTALSSQHCVQRSQRRSKAGPPQRGRGAEHQCHSLKARRADVAFCFLLLQTTDACLQLRLGQTNWEERLDKSSYSCVSCSHDNLRLLLKPHIPYAEATN